MINFVPLFTTARVVRSTYQVVLTTWLFYHLIKRIYGREIPRNGRVTYGRTPSGAFGSPD